MAAVEGGGGELKAGDASVPLASAEGLLAVFSLAGFSLAGGADGGGPWAEVTAELSVTVVETVVDTAVE